MKSATEVSSVPRPVWARQVSMCCLSPRCLEAASPSCSSSGTGGQRYTEGQCSSPHSVPGIRHFRAQWATRRIGPCWGEGLDDLHRHQPSPASPRASLVLSACDYTADSLSWRDAKSPCRCSGPGDFVHRQLEQIEGAENSVHASIPVWLLTSLQVCS